MKKGLVCQGNLGHKMWGASPMTVPMIHCDIHPYKKSSHLLAVSPAERVFFTEFRQTYTARLFFTMRYDWMYSSQVYSGSP
jgi:hypothetical protein